MVPTEKKFLKFLIENNIPYIKKGPNNFLVKEEDLLPFELEIRKKFKNINSTTPEPTQKEAGK
jgi:hypothetical protein